MKIDRNKSEMALLETFNSFGPNLECVIVLGLMKDLRPVIKHSDKMTNMQRAFLVSFVKAWEVSETMKGLTLDETPK